jgi:hypothetical protein
MANLGFRRGQGGSKVWEKEFTGSFGRCHPLFPEILPLSFSKKTLFESHSNSVIDIQIKRNNFYLHDPEMDSDCS